MAESTAEPGPRPLPRAHRGRSLAAAITLLAAGVAALVAVIAGLVSVEVVRTAMVNMTHQQLSAGMAVVTDGDAADAERAAQAWSSGSGDLWAVISPTGAVHGTATRWVDQAVVRRVLSGQRVADTARNLPAPVVFEARPIGGGGIVLARRQSSIEAATRGILDEFIPIVLGAALVAAIGGALLARRIARPLVGTAAAARTLASGARGVEIPRARIPEVDDVAQALAGLDRALVVSEGRQREFLLSVSHELRTPLTALRGYAEALADGMVPPERVGEVAGTLVSEALRAERFVEDLLQLARLESDDFRIEVSDTDLVAVARSAAAAWQGAASRLRVGIEVATNLDSLVVHTDAHRVRQLVDGLIENALRVSPDGSLLQIDVSEAVDGARLTVRDQGPGLTEEDIARAFDRGFLRDRHAGSRPVGTGLGLSIANRTAGLLGGSISAASVTGGGAQFTVRLPTGHPQEPD